MKKLSFLATSILLSGSIAFASLPVHANLPFSVNSQQMPSLAPMLEKVTPGVVLISVTGTHVEKSKVPEAFKFFFGNPNQNQNQNQSRKREFRGLGSGVIIDAEQGYIVTNSHVINEADEIQITLKDGRQITAKKIGSDASSDIALLQIEAKDLIEVKLADSDNIRVGDFAVAIGSPFGLGQTVTSGIISALGRSGLNAQNYEDFIQTDAAINSGNSGGALINLQGKLVGINTAILGPNGGNVGIGFAIPSNMVDNIVKQLIEFGEVRRGVLGVLGRSVNGEIAEALELESSQGGFIEQVEVGSAADEAGIESGDVITKVNGKMVKTFAAIRGKIGTIGAGKSVELTVIKKDGSEKTYNVTLKKQETAKVEAASIHKMLDGAELENSENGRGIDIKSVAEGSPAAFIGLQKGDIISGINRTRIKSIGELRSYLNDNKGVFAINIIRGNSTLFLMIR
ncbi:MULTISPECIES: Do family serine endopeptidase [unclassified Colwellia]|uniref:Do family serine endopeptidase n=1 Tax=unclassified Colwellia TaxID=196834 RepID=UPI0015F39A39|nr:MULTISPECIES: Do family serine endopeptidase [unclassified Colwellia]MBA6232538.1 Do family serine endopeptidase [Colwellia sp. MB02u-7]MBA6235321.1 Do family serine endopeptidase [Colwellia sp. MB02u-11]MBA6299371.1 Do family serine endopeptidase [Colwellia sp. MB3u-22]MBA6310350.1 Do family serine endopeptidase [Colwellia sp. MB3u-64]